MKTSACELHQLYGFTVLIKQRAGRETTIASVARELATTPRTLQRRLAAAGFSFQDLVEQTRQEIAEKYLTDLSLSIAEVLI